VCVSTSPPLNSGECEQSNEEKESHETEQQPDQPPTWPYRREHAITRHRPYLFSRQGFIEHLRAAWIQREFSPLAQEPALFGHFAGVEPDFTGIFSLYCRCRMEKRQSILLPRVSMASRCTFPPVGPCWGTHVHESV
jgi:hypothetical protein